ncbi:MAG TPA: hypothetical protein DEQ61_02120 [Streptomyces sp.]|nr:hypothetical protein [Streptomyces sp.]
MGARLQRAGVTVAASPRPFPPDAGNVGHNAPPVLISPMPAPTVTDAPTPAFRPVTVPDLRALRGSQPHGDADT